jgi:diguanylate cyclase
VITDIDHFKKVNDTWGHVFGDQVLRAVAQSLKSCVEAGQMAARVGGEEFAVLLPGAGLPQAQQLAERIRATIAGAGCGCRDSQESIGQVTVSLGVAARRHGESAEAWFERADQALYASKQGGRNRVTAAAA